MPRSPLSSFFLCLCLLSHGGGCLARAPEHSYSRMTPKPLEEVVFDLKLAISEYNFRLTAENRIGEAISIREQIPFPGARVFAFCNLRYAQRLLEIDPDYLLRMPCRAAVQRSGSHTTVSVQLLPEDDPPTHQIAVQINRILRAIVDEASE